MNESNNRGSRKKSAARLAWEKRRNERILKHKKEQFEIAIAKYNSTKHIMPSDVRHMKRQELLATWNRVKDGDNNLDKQAVLKEITRRVKKMDPESKDPVQTLTDWVANNVTQQ